MHNIEEKFLAPGEEHTAREVDYICDGTIPSGALWQGRSLCGWAESESEEEGGGGKYGGSKRLAGACIVRKQDPHNTGIGMMMPL